MTYDNQIGDEKGKAFALVKPHKVNSAMKLFSEARFGVDTLKVELPVNMNFVQGYGHEACMTQQEAAEAFKAQANSTHIPYIYLSAGMDSQLFNKSLQFAAENGSTFNGVLCGRATWQVRQKCLLKMEK